MTNNFGVEYGRNSGAQVNYVTKSGTNNFHGSGFEYYTGNWADSLTNYEKNPFDGICAPGQNPATTGCIPPHVARFTENRWGGTLGGPILPNKIFFFTSFLQDTQKGPTNFTTTDILPTGLIGGAGGLQQLEACWPGNQAVAALNSIGPYAIKAGNPTPINTENLTVSNGTTSCTAQFGGITRSLPGIYNDYESVGRVDFALSPRDQFFTRYLFQQQVFAGGFGSVAQYGNGAEGGTLDSPDRAQQIALDWTRNWTPHLVNQARFGYVRLFAGTGSGTSDPTCTTANLGNCPTFYRQAAGVSVWGLGVNLPQNRPHQHLAVAG